MRSRQSHVAKQLVATVVMAEQANRLKEANMGRLLSRGIRAADASTVVSTANSL